MLAQWLDTVASCHHGPGHPGHLVGQRYRRNLGRSALHELHQPRMAGIPERLGYTSPGGWSVPPGEGCEPRDCDLTLEYRGDYMAPASQKPITVEAAAAVANKTKAPT